MATLESEQGKVTVIRTGNLGETIFQVSATTPDNDLTNNQLRIDFGGGVANPGGNGSTICFIATAAYGSYLEPEVRLLRDFRDRHLLPHAAGRLFVELYYRHSQPLADYIATHHWARFVTKTLLTPLVYWIKYPVVGLGLLLSVLVGVAMFRCCKISEKWSQSKKPELLH